MCLAVPARVLAIQGQEAEVDIGGVRRRISVLLTPEACAGDYVLIHTGFAINIVDEQEAQETLKLFAEIEAMGAQASETPDDEVH